MFDRVLETVNGHNINAYYTTERREGCPVVVAVEVVFSEVNSMSCNVYCPSLETVKPKGHLHKFANRDFWADRLELYKSKNVALLRWRSLMFDWAKAERAKIDELMIEVMGD